MSTALAPGDMVALENEDGDWLPVFDGSDNAVNSLYCDDVAFVVCVSLPPIDLGDDHRVPPVYPLLLLPVGPMGWILDPHLLRKL